MPSGEETSPATPALRGVLPALWPSPRADFAETDREIRRLLTAAGRVGYRLLPPGTWQQAQHAGLVLLAGEVTARTLHHILAEEHGPETLAPLADLTTALYPPPAAELQHTALVHASVTARRLLSGLYAHAAPWQHRALTVLASTATERWPIFRISYETAACVSRGLGRDRGPLALVRAAVLAARTNPQADSHPAAGQTARTA